MILAYIDTYRLSYSAFVQLSYKYSSDNYSLSKVFSSLGEFADVYKGILKSREGKGVVAVKVLRVSPVMHCSDKM